MKDWRPILVLGHVGLITASNVLVLFPMSIIGFHSTWGAISYPILFIFSDLTTRILGQSIARQVIFISMIPAFMASYGINHFFGHAPELSIRIAFASFLAYVIGQILDITVFDRYRRKGSWWLAPVLASLVGNSLDNLIFFTVAFYRSNNPFLSTHWGEIALVDLLIKYCVSLFAVVPLYGIALQAMKLTFKPETVREPCQ